jgi:elongation factor P
MRAPVGAAGADRGAAPCRDHEVPFSRPPVSATLNHDLTVRRRVEGASSQTEGIFVASMEYSQVRKGQVLVGDGGQLFYVVDRDLNTPGNWRAILQLKLKNLKTGSITINRVRPQDKVEVAYLEKRPMQYIYQEGDGFVFMDTETYDQITLNKELVGDLMLYLKEGDTAQVTFYEEKALSLDLPATVELKVVETEPAVKGATAAAQYKPATLETGLKITVPPFVNIGEVIAVDTRTGEYLSRAK